MNPLYENEISVLEKLFKTHISCSSGKQFFEFVDEFVNHEHIGRIAIFGGVFKSLWYPYYLNGSFEKDPSGNTLLHGKVPYLPVNDYDIVLEPKGEISEHEVMSSCLSHLISQFPDLKILRVFRKEKNTTNGHETYRNSLRIKLGNTPYHPTIDIWDIRSQRGIEENQMAPILENLLECAILSSEDMIFIMDGSFGEFLTKGFFFDCLENERIKFINGDKKHHAHLKDLSKTFGIQEVFSTKARDIDLDRAIQKAKPYSLTVEGVDGEILHKFHNEYSIRSVDF